MNKLVSERVYYLHNLALSSVDADMRYSPRYIDMMERVARRMDYTISSRIKRSYCKKCKHPYDQNVRIRLKNNIISITCGSCGDVRRMPY